MDEHRAMTRNEALRRVVVPAALVLAVAGLVVVLVMPRSAPSASDPTPVPSPPSVPTAAPATSRSAVSSPQAAACSGGQTQWSFTSHSRPRFDHLSLVEVADGIAIGRDWSIDPFEELRATLTGADLPGAPVSRAEVYARIVTQVRERKGAELAPLGSTTGTKALAARAPSYDDRGDRRFVGYAGRTAWRGGWVYRYCEQNVWRVIRGAWTGYEQRDHRGVEVCRDADGARHFKESSWPWRACRQFGDL